MSPLSFRYKYKNVWVKIGNEKNLEKAQQTMVAMEIGRNLNFGDVILLCKKAGRKLVVLSGSVGETI